VKAPVQTIRTQTGFFRRLIRVGAFRGTVLATLFIATFSFSFSLLVMLVLNRVSLMGIFISTAIPLIIVPMHWYPFARISEQLDATEIRLRKSEGKYRSILEKMSEAYIEIDQGGGLTFFSAGSRATAAPSWNGSG
jgi:PAS domain-containing protein